jgi:hypothetical protein
MTLADVNNGGLVVDQYFSAGALSEAIVTIAAIALLVVAILVLVLVIRRKKSPPGTQTKAKETKAEIPPKQNAEGLKKK